MTAFQTTAAMVGLRKLFEKRHFCVCDLDTLCELAGVHMSKKQHAAFRLLHCVDYGDMEPGVRKQLMAEVIALFEAGPSFDMNELNKVGGFAVSMSPGESKATTVQLVMPPKSTPKSKLLSWFGFN